MMHESVTKSPSPANFYQHKSEDLLSSNQAKASMSARDMLSAPGGASRRPQSVGLQKPERSGRPVATNANGGGRWRISSSGQLVDSVLPEWDIADDMVKLQITEGSSEPKSHLRTPPHLRGHMGVVGIETSPLETSSETSLGSESPNTFDQPGILGSHSRGSSADTTASSHTPSYSGGQTLQAGPYTPLKVSGMSESRNRPHSYSGGLSSADLLRLQQAGGSPGVPEWSSPNGTPERQAPAEQPTYPSLVGQNAGSRSQETLLGPRSDEAQGSYETPTRQQYGSLAQGPALHAAGPVVPSPPYPTANRSNNIAPPNPQFRQRAFSPPQPVPPVMQSPPNFGYPTPLPLTVTGGQQLYDMMLPTPPLENPAMTRLQQQTPYRGGHQHSASDPASLRDPAVLALLNSNMQAAFAAGQMYGPAAMVPPNMAMFNQFYGPEGYASPDLAMMARLQPQYTGQYGIPSAQGVSGAAGPNRQQVAQSTGGSPGPGPNANNRKLGLYKTELCRSWEEKGTCRYGAKCQFAHGEDELRLVQRHPKYKTEICRTFWVSGSCPYGKRCCFIHTELPGAAGQGGQDNGVLHGVGEQRPRSDSDPNEGSTSLLARISAKRQEPLGANKPGSVSTTPPATSFGGRPGSLRVDTSVLDPNAGKQNKSAFPSFTHNGILVSSNDEAPAMSPGPVTAAPDFGRHAAARMDIVGAQPRVRKTTDVHPNARHSFNGSEIQLDLSASTPTAPNQGQFSMAADMQSQRAARINGHVRSGSAGNWGSATRTGGHLTAYPLSSIPGGELKANMPWADYSASRRAENNWA